MDVPPMPNLPDQEAFGSAPLASHRVSPDGHWWLNGSEWTRLRPPMRPVGASRSREPVLGGALWLLSLTVWMPVGLLVMRFNSSMRSPLGALFVTTLLLPLLSTLAWGIHLGRKCQRDFAVISPICGGAALGFAYVLAFALGPDANADTEAAAGVVILGIPALLALGALVALGYGGGATWRRWHSRRTSS